MSTQLAMQEHDDPRAHYFVAMAEYNRWMNERIYAVCGALTVEDLRNNAGAFFGSILGTLNHIMLGDLIWLRRFANHPARFAALAAVPQDPPIEQLDQRLYNDLHALREARTNLDTLIVRWTQALHPDDLAHPLEYDTLAGDAQRRNFGLLVQHFFNHQTHHRGQATTLLSQRGLDPGDTDLLLLIPNTEAQTA